MVEVTKQKFDCFLEKYCDERNNNNITFKVVKNKVLPEGYEYIYYIWEKDEKVIAFSTKIEGCCRRKYEIKI